MQMLQMRIGEGWDIHALVPGRDLVLGGIKVPHTTGLLGLARANAVAVVPEDVRTVVAGDTLHCLLLDS